MEYSTSKEGIELLTAVQNQKVIIYGAHLIAVELYRFLYSHLEDWEFLGFAVTSLADNPNTIETYSVQEFKEYQAEKNILILIAMPQKYHHTVSDFVKSRGFQKVLCISQSDMEDLKSVYLLKKNPLFSAKGYFLSEDEYDKSWLNIKKKENTELYFKFPTLYYRNLDDMIQKLECRNLPELYKQCFGIYRRLDSLCAKRGQTSKPMPELLNIYMVFSQWDNGKRNVKKLPGWVVPIQAGSSLTEEKSDAILDETGESISDKNRSLAELTAAYWIWKNDTHSVYKGLCHYRRHFVISEEEIQALEQNEVEVILPIPRYAPGGVGKMFLAETPVKKVVYENMIRAVKELYPNEENMLKEYLNQDFYVPNNMVIAKNEIYNRYCEWLFPVLFRMLELDREINYGHETDRHAAYAAELLTSFYFSKQKEKLKLYVTDFFWGG